MVHSLIIHYILPILGSFDYKTFANYLAINVLPVPGGPNNNIPFTCFIPYFSNTEGGNLLDANALLKISNNSLSRPPIPN